MIELQIFSRLIDTLRMRWAVLRSEPEAGYTSEFFVVTGLIVAVAIGALAYLAVQIMTAAHNVQVSNNTGS
jgi:protein-S-isoprenylcysteine O-methyltransferase Ste14